MVLSTGKASIVSNFIQSYLTLAGNVLVPLNEVVMGSLDYFLIVHTDVYYTDCKLITHSEVTSFVLTNKPES